ncbi:hypothetical protein [uncultured Aquimarina sp.]|uniref:hypothetical protein n=1 Tax=uncultured Aquimarina sp. TaxID=575652 RepID=UPI00262C5BBF|nr:hypothetical protein [uncultured Aquimarina sp.]
MQPYHNLIVLGITFWISYHIKKRLQGNEGGKSKKSGCFLFGIIYSSYTVLCYLCVFLFGPSVEGLYQKMTMDKYQATIVEVDSYEQKRRSGKSPLTIQQITVKFKPKTSADFITKKLSITSRTPPDTEQPYEIRYNERTSKTVSNDSTHLNVLLIVLGLIPFYFVIYGIYYAFDLKLPKWFPDFRKLMDKY